MSKAWQCQKYHVDVCLRYSHHNDARSPGLGPSLRILGFHRDNGKENGNYYNGGYTVLKQPSYRAVSDRPLGPLISVHSMCFLLE